MSISAENKLYSIKEASQLSGLPTSTLRYYESIGIIDTVTRDHSSRHRKYTQSDLNTIDAIACLNATGMPLEDMRAYLANRTKGAAGAEAEIELLETQQRRLNDELLFVQLRQQYLDLKINYWRAVKVGDEAQARVTADEARRTAMALKFSKSNQH